MSSLATKIQPEPTSVYMNLAQGIRLRYPSGWKKHEESSPAGFLLAFLSPPEGPADRFSENVNLIIGHPPMPVTVEQATAYNQQSIMMNMPIKNMSEPEATQMAGLPAYQIIYSGPLQNGLAGKWRQLCAVKDKKVYTFTYTAEEAKFEKFLPVIQEIIASLEIK